MLGLVIVTTQSLVTSKKKDLFSWTLMMSIATVSVLAKKDTRSMQIAL